MTVSPTENSSNFATNIFLFHRDLRIFDNTSLIEQLKEIKDDVIPIFIFPPEQIDSKKNEYFSHNSVQFMIESLKELSDEIKKKKGKLYFFKGDTFKVIKEIHNKITINSLSFNVDYTPYAIKRDNELKEWCESENIKCITKEDYLLYKVLEKESNKSDGNPYQVYTPFLRNCLKNLKVRDVDKFRSFNFKINKELEKIKFYIDENDLDDFYEENEYINVNGGRELGLKIINKIEKFKDYGKKRDFFTYKTTFLGPYIKFGCVSIREVYHNIVKKLGKSSELLREIIFREYFTTLYYHFPHMLKGQLKGKNKSFKEEFDNVPWSNNKNHFEKWCNGETGIISVDVGMRQMNKIGYMHNRLRMIVASFLIKDLHIDWRKGEKFFATKLIDYDPINNSAGWLGQQGSIMESSMPWWRIFNPITQLEKYDPDCEFVYQWIPELKNVPKEDILKWDQPEIHEKYLKDGIKYFKPIVNHDQERLETLKIFKKSLKRN